jgi:hypothetical protein
MAITAQAGVFSFGPQVAKGTLASDYWKHRASDIDLATVSDDRTGPPEVGGLPVPTIPYRAGVMATGGALINPRLEDSLGWLLYGAFGAVASTANKDVLGNTVTGMYDHQFKFAADAGYVPWITFRKYVPGGGVAANSLGETFKDTKIVALTMALPNDGLINTRVDALGITGGTNFETDPTWNTTYENTEFEDYDSIPIGSVVGSYLKVPAFSATALPVVQATATLQNAPLDVRQEKIFGSPYLEDVTIVGRQFTVDMVLKWRDPQLYRAILTGSTTGTQWVATPWVNNLDIVSLSSVNAPSLSTPYGLRIKAASVMYQVQGGIRLAGGQAVMMRVTGTAIGTTGEYAEIHIGNKATQYSWPT